MLKNFTEDSDFNVYFVDNNANVDDKSEEDIFLFDNVYIQCYNIQDDQFITVYICIKNCLE